MNRRPIHVLLIEDNPGDIRLVRELLEVVKETVGHKCAVALRWASNAAHRQEQDDWLEMTQSLNGLPDLWDLTVDDYSIEMGPSRFVKEGALEEQVGGELLPQALAPRQVGVVANLAAVRALRE